MTSMFSSALAIRFAPNAHSKSPPNCPGGCASAASSSNSNGSLGWCSRRNLIAARPSRPSPHTATRREPRSATRIEHGHIPVRNSMGVPHPEQGPTLDRVSVPQRGEALVQSAHDLVLPPVGMVSEVRHDAGAFGGFSDAFERLVFLQAAQFGKAVALRLVIQNIAAKDLDQFGFRDKRGKRKEHEPAFRTITAPVTSARRARLPKSRIAAAEYSKIWGMIRKAPSNLDLRQRPQQRKIGDTRG